MYKLSVYGAILALSIIGGVASAADDGPMYDGDYRAGETHLVNERKHHAVTNNESQVVRQSDSPGVVETSPIIDRRNSDRQVTSTVPSTQRAPQLDSTPDTQTPINTSVEDRSSSVGSSVPSSNPEGTGSR